MKLFHGYVMHVVHAVHVMYAIHRNILSDPNESDPNESDPNGKYDFEARVIHAILPFSSHSDRFQF